MWKVKQILEADYGCEERLPGQALMALVCLENELGEQRQLEVEDDWLVSNGIDEGDEWPEDTSDVADRQSEWMEGYMDALEELEDAE